VILHEVYTISEILTEMSIDVGREKRAVFRGPYRAGYAAGERREDTAELDARSVLRCGR